MPGALSWGQQCGPGRACLGWGDIQCAAGRLPCMKEPQSISPQPTASLANGSPEAARSRGTPTPGWYSTVLRREEGAGGRCWHRLCAHPSVTLCVTGRPPQPGAQVGAEPQKRPLVCPKFSDSLRVGSDLRPGLSDSRSSALSTQPHLPPSCQPTGPWLPSLAAPGLTLEP